MHRPQSLRDTNVDSFRFELRCHVANLVGQCGEDVSESNLAHRVHDHLYNIKRAAPDKESGPTRIARTTSVSLRRVYAFFFACAAGAVPVAGESATVPGTVVVLLNSSVMLMLNEPTETPVTEPVAFTVATPGVSEE